MANMAPAAAGVDILHAGYTDREEAMVSEPISYSASHPPSFAEYLYWADLKRAEEDADTTAVASEGWGRAIYRIRKGKKYDPNAAPGNATTDLAQKHSPMADEKSKYNKEGVTVTESSGPMDEYHGLSEHDRELLTARRVLRQAGWMTVFYLITCDILGPFNAPYAISALGMVPGILLYILFGIFAFIGGLMLSKIYLRIDSARYPITLYGDMCERTVGRWLKYIASFLQCILTINVGLICLTNGQSLSQIIVGPHGNGHLCFSVTVLIWALVGMCIGQVRSLGKFSIFANASVWMNILIIFISIGYFARSLPNYAAAMASYGIGPGPIQVHATLPGQALFTQVNGVFNMVFAFGGAMIFPEIMAEMRRPRDFVKGMAVAQLLIISLYLMYGITVYALQGQFVQAQSYTGISTYTGQTICNVFGIMSGSIAAGLYGNIGLKVVYRLVVEQLLKGPGLMTRKGRITWSCCVVVYWSIAFVLGSAIPSVGTLTGLLAAMGFFHFTYTFPPLMMLGLDMQIDAARADEPFTTPGVAPKQVDTWFQFSRWKRGFMAGGSRRVMWKCLNVLFLVAALATDGMGLWASGTDLKDALKVSAASSLGCTAPV